ncbi:hypothetical protein J7I44_12490 [Frateuria sp. MAH-13]|uniref:Uncharacterized protein n=1 Tax=Frateuria flava TaxID=2821489 RepID=A0ABS4DQA3_9GAMM|nr:hypothetical protein [Frateuria flava]MBP1475123.1 hypothetical protein [Frateuria flava]
MTISIHTLTMSVLAVQARIEELQNGIERAEDPELSWLEEDLLAYSRAQTELKRMYVEEQQRSDNLVPYEELFD